MLHPRLLPFTYFAGTLYRQPYQWTYSSHLPILTKVQTDGSYIRHSKRGGAGVFIVTPEGTSHKYAHPLFRLESSTEAEWASVYYGMSMMKTMRKPIVGIENDCLGVVRQIMLNDTGRHEYARYYHHKIRELGKEMEWCGIRWSPRGLNRADSVLKELK